MALPVALLAVRHPGRLGAASSSAAPTWCWPCRAWSSRLALSLLHRALRRAASATRRAPLLILAYAIMFFPLALVGVRASVAQAPVSLEEVGPVARPAPAGGPPAGDPAARSGPGLAAAFCLVFLSVVTELTATLILVPTGVQTLATQFWAYQPNLSYGQAAPFALVMIAVAAVPELRAGPVLRPLGAARPEDDDMTQLARRRAGQGVRRAPGPGRPRPRRAGGLAHRDPRPVRQRQDHPAADPGRASSGPTRARCGSAPRSPTGPALPAAGAAADRLRAAGRQPVPAPDRGRQRRFGLPPQGGRGGAAGVRGAAGRGRPGRAGPALPAPALRRAAAAGRAGPGAGHRSRRSSCSTSRSPRSTRTCGPASGPTCSGC